MLEKVGIREFRNNISKYIGATSPVAVSRHGQTVGYFVPVRSAPNEADFEAFESAKSKLNTLLSEHGITEEELANEFRQVRKSPLNQG